MTDDETRLAALRIECKDGPEYAQFLFRLLDAARKDGERIDWLEHKSRATISRNAQVETTEWEIAFPCDWPEYRPLREAIDAARAAAEGARNPECGVVGEPEAGRSVCRLPKGHEGYHQEGDVRWLGYFVAAAEGETTDG